MKLLIFLLAGTVMSMNYPGNSRLLYTPADSARIFMPGIVSAGYNERDMAISPDGTEMFYTIIAPRNAFSVIVTRKMKNDKWSEPSVASFSGSYADLEPAFSPDGQKIFYASRRPVLKGTPKRDFDIWYVERKGSGWSQPIHAGDQVNSPANEYYPSVTNTGAVYFTAERKNTLGSEDIYKCDWKDGKYSEAINIGGGVNSKLDEFNAFVDPAERYLIFSAEGGQGDIGRGDLYISYRTGDTWGKAVNMGPAINSARLDYCPFVWKDKLYFTSERMQSLYADVNMSYTRVMSDMNSWGNGWGDVYVITADMMGFK